MSKADFTPTTAIEIARFIAPVRPRALVRPQPVPSMGAVEFLRPSAGKRDA